MAGILGYFVAAHASPYGAVELTPVYQRPAMLRAMGLHATVIILVQNHPGGDPTPSREDVEMTREIKLAAQTLGRVHDHIIVGNGRWLSFRKEGLL